MGAGGRSRKSSSADPAMTPGFVGTSSAPGGGEEPHHSLIHSGTSSMTYFLADEATVNVSTAGSPGGSGTFGLRNLDTSMEDADTARRKGPFISTEYSRQSRDDSGDDEGDDDQDDIRALDERSVASFQSSIHPGPGSVGRPPQELLSQPLTPILGPSPDPQGSPLRSPSGISYRSEEDVVSEPAESEEAPGRIFMEKPMSPEVLVAPQLIMPEITIPSRRPFTMRGKNIGRLKVLIAGDSGMIPLSAITITAYVFSDGSLGIGKTSLIKSIVQASEDIVHVDPISTGSSLSGSRNGSYFTMNNRASGDSTKKITEVYASTRPYPHWWSELDDSKLLRRRKSKYGTEEQVIERNLCFVDTPGYGSGTSVCSFINIFLCLPKFSCRGSILDGGLEKFLEKLTGELLTVPRVYRACCSICRVSNGTDADYREWRGGGIAFSTFG